MRPQESFLCQPIRNLQTMLRVIEKDRGHENLLIPDGIYGSATMQAVSDFQKEHGLPPTGTADQVTWEAIREAYLPARIRLVPAQSLQILLGPGEVLDAGQQHPNLYLVQAVLSVLSEQYGNIKKPPFSGRLDAGTAASLSSFQTLCRLPATGKLDKVTWKYLALHYPLAGSLCIREKDSDCRK